MDSPTHSVQLRDQALHSSSFVFMEITFVAMTALIPLMTNASVAFFGEPNLTKCIFITARVTVAMILKVNLKKIRWLVNRSASNESAQK